jgi:sialidase-1
MRSLVLMMAPLILGHAVFAVDTPTVSTVWQAGEDGYHTYRIPAVLVVPNGDLLAFCEGRRNNSRDHGNVDLLQKRSSDGGLTWGARTVVCDEGGEADVTIGNPCPVVDRTTGIICMPFCRDNDRVFVTSSADEGASWSEPREITADVKRSEWGWYATGPGVGIQLESGEYAGRLVVPCDHRSPVYDCGSHVIYSDNQGETWKLSQNVIAPGANECQVVELSDGRLLLNARMQTGRTTGERGISYSSDGGATWSPLSQHSGLPDPIVQASLIRCSSRDTDEPDHLLFSNPDVPLSVTPGSRVNLTVRLSPDRGASWPVRRTLHPGPAAYSCLVRLADGKFGCLYEAGDESAYESIRFARFDLDWVRGR